MPIAHPPSQRILLAALAAALVLLLPAAGSSQITFNMSTTPTSVDDSSNSQLLGTITLTAVSGCGTNADGQCLSTPGGVLTVFYSGVPIVNTLGTGIQVCEIVGNTQTCNAAGTLLTGTIQVFQTQIQIGIKTAIDVAAGNTIVISGVRGNIAAQCPAGCPGFNINGQMGSTPTAIANYIPATQVVATAFTDQSGMQIVSGSGQLGTAGFPLANPFVVRVIAPQGGPAVGVTVTFAVVSGGGILSATTVVTDGNGQASTLLTLGPAPVTNTVSASAPGIPGSPLTFTASGILNFSIFSGNHQFGLVGTALTNPLVVRISGAADAPAPGQAVTFSLVSGNAAFTTPTDTTTNQDGLASVGLTLGLTTGTVTVRATTPNLPDTVLTFTVNAVINLPVAISIFSGNNQTAAVGQALQPFVVRVTTAQQNPSSGVLVTFAVTSGGGTLSAAQALTNAEGLASTILTLGQLQGVQTVTATSPGLAGSPLTFSATATPPPPSPVVGAGGVVNGASFRLASAPNGAVASNVIAAIFGTNFASGTASATALPLPTSLNGTSVTFNGVLAPLFFISPTQINAQLPLDLPLGPVSVVVTRNGVPSAPQQVSIAAVSPGIFTVNRDGTGAGAILHADTFLPVSTANPARRGGFLLIYCTGLGQVTAPVPPGFAPPSPPPQTLSLPQVTIGGVPAQVSFSGLAPGFAGLYQVNIQVPPAAPLGNQQPLVLTINGVPANTVTVAVQ